jgi:GDPmannose 4,6-dehydratase
VVRLKKVIISGITGQDGSLLARYLVKNKYKVLGLSRFDYDYEYFWRLGDLINNISILKVNLQKKSQVEKIVNDFEPDEFYHLSANISPHIDEKIFEIYKSNLNPTMNIIESLVNSKKKFKLFIAGSCLMYSSNHKLKNEYNITGANTPYSIAKATAFQLSNNYKNRYDLFICTGILYNHVSEIGTNSVIRKITQGVAKIKLGKAKVLRLGNIDISRDWGYANDYVEAMYKIIQSSSPSNYEIGTGVATSLKDVLNIAFNYIDKQWQEYVVIDTKFVRNSDVKVLLADPSKINNEIGWKSKKKVKNILDVMLQNDINIERKK